MTPSREMSVISTSSMPLSRIDASTSASERRASRSHPVTRTTPSRTSTAAMTRSAPTASTMARSVFGESAATVPMTTFRAPQSSQRWASSTERIPPPTCTRRSRAARRATFCVSTGAPLREPSRSTMWRREPGGTFSDSSTASGSPYACAVAKSPRVRRTTRPPRRSREGITSMPRSSSGREGRPLTISPGGTGRRTRGRSAPLP